MSKKVAIIGAGLAGCSIAYELSRYDSFDISIFDKNSNIAEEASGNFAGILAPYLTSDNNYSDQFHTLGYNLLIEFIDKHKQHLDICNKGVLQILSDKKELGRYKKIFQKRDISKNLAVLSDNTVYYPNAISLEPKSLCKLWLDQTSIKKCLNTELLNIQKHENKWLLEFDTSKCEFDIVIFTGSYKLFNSISYLNKIPVYPSQGQLTVVEKEFDIENTTMDKGYIIPNYKNTLQVIGATFRDNSDTFGDIRDSDNDHNISQIKNMFNSNLEKNIRIVDSRVATRCVTSDHLPLIGKLVDYKKFAETFFKPLSKGYPKSKMPNIEYEEGLYLASGFGSKGISSSAVAAKIITSQITNQEQIVSDKLLLALSPQRFWVRSFKKGVC